MASTVNDSAYWMDAVAIRAQALSTIKMLVAEGIYPKVELQIAQHQYDSAVQMYTNPHGVQKGIS